MEEDLIDEGNSRLDALKHQIEKRRWREELRGVEHLGIRWYAGSAGRQAVMESLQYAATVEAQGGMFATDWKGENGQWALGVTKTDLETVAGLLGQRRQQCFARERELVDMAETDPDNFDEQIIGTGWPG